METLNFNFKIWIETEDGLNVFGEGKYHLLQAIEETGSIKKAISRLGLSYRKTWDNLKKIEQRLGFPIIQPVRGGPDGGSTTLTPEGKMLLTAFGAMQKESDKVFRDLSDEIRRKLLHVKQ